MKDDLFLTKRGVATIAACIVKTLDETDPTFRNRFMIHLKDAYSVAREPDGSVQEMELYTWVREMLDAK